ncbi:MAG: thioester reductase domain-containing protein [Catenulispora sp.]|nr:thioester reductase domain-containing protein [Catenulispora sp.]
MTDLSARLAQLSDEQRAALAERLKAARAADAPGTAERTVTADTIVPVPRTDGTVPLSFAQERIWFQEQFNPGTAYRNMSGVARVPVPADPELFTECLGDLIARHEILRTRFVIRDGEPVGLVADRVEPPVRILPQGPEAEREALFAADARRPFDLATAPLLRMTVAPDGPGSCLIQLTMHHIVSDGFSNSVFFREMGELYRMRQAGLYPALPRLPFQFADYAAWERRCADSPAQASALKYWTRHLDGAPRVLALPAGRPRPARVSGRGARLPVPLPDPLAARIRDLSRQLGVTPFVTALAAFVTVLSRYTGQDDLVVGVPVAHREQRGVEQVIGPFLNTLALRFDLSGDPGFATVADRVRQTFLAGLEHQGVPFERVLQAVPDGREPARSPVFQAVFNFQTDQTAASGVTGIDLRDLPNGGCDFDLLLDLSDDGTGISAHLDYYADVYEEADAARIAESFRTLLAAAADAPDTPIARLPLLAEPERKAAFAAGSGPAAGDDPVLPVHRMVLARAAEQPTLLAVTDDGVGHGADDGVGRGVGLTYADLAAKSAAVAAALTAAGARPGNRVAICLPRSADLIVAVLGAWRAGCCCVPLDPADPEDWREQVLRDAEPAVVLTGEFLNATAPAAAFADQDSYYPCAALVYVADPAGRPTGVLVSHRNLAALVAGLCAGPGLDASDVLLAVAPPAVGACLPELFAPLAIGGRVVVASGDDSGAADGRRLAELIAAHHVTVMPGAPAIWWQLIDSGWTGSRGLRALCTPCTDERLSPDLARSLLERAAEVWNLHGQTETTIWSTVHQVGPEDVTRGVIPLGRPLAGTSAIVLDAGMNPVPPGAVGELWIGGDGVGLGYHHLPELTATRFASPPGTDALLVRTGKLVRSRPDGVLEPVGRDTSADRSTLPETGEPAAAETGPHGPDEESAHAEPRTETERVLAGMWCELLDLDEVGVRDGFFELGGYSLLATKLMFRIRETFGVELPLQALFEGEPTIARLAELLTDQSAPSGAEEADLDLAAEARLAEDIRPAPGAHRHSGRHPQHILLTGGTGFVGAFLLAELLATTEATMFCLVRAQSAEHGRERIKAALTGYGLWDPAWDERIIAVPGALERPRLGLSRPMWDHLAAMVDVIHHCGAEVNFLWPYRALAAANVRGTAEILRLACDGAVKPVHFVSTIYVFSRFDYPPGTEFYEDMYPAHTLENTFGYTQSKWVAEQMVLEAGRRGVPVYVYRAGRMAGDSRTGVCHTYDFVWQVTKVGLELGAAPLMDMTLDFTPVDYAVRALVHLSRQPELAGRAFHLLSPTQITEKEFVSWFTSYGYDAEQTTFAEWCARVVKRAADLDDRTAGALAPFLAGTLPLDRMPAAHFDQGNVELGLAGSGITCPVFDEQLLHSYLDYFRSVGYLAEPTAPRRTGTEPAAGTDRDAALLAGTASSGGER